MIRNTARRPPVRRAVRAIAAGVSLAVLGGGLAGCGKSPEVVTVLGPWLGDEATQFTTVLDGSGIRYRYQGTRTPGEALQSAMQTGEGPDIVVLPAIGDLATFVKDGKARDLRDIVGGERGNYDPFWLMSPRSDGSTGEIYAIPTKVNLKSMVWRDRRRTPAAARTWQDALAGRWCMGMGNPPNSGWPGTDWIEDILLHQDPGAYAKWAAGGLSWTALGTAWETWGGVVGRTPGGAVPVLLTQYGDAGRGLTSTDPGEACTYDHQPSFILGSYAKYAPRKDGEPDLSPFVFDQYPPDGAPQNWAVVSADVAALFSDSGPARRLMAYLASEEGQSAWPADSGAFSVNTKVRVARPGAGGEISEILAGRRNTMFCLDASDLMPTQLREAFYTGVRDYLAHPADLSAILTRLDGVQKNSRWDVTRPACSTAG
jgi:alpha-glucoside transport system substrate-binding protein